MSVTPSPESTEPKRTKKLRRLWEAVGWLGIGLVAGIVPLTCLVLWRLESEDFGFALLAPEEGRGVWQLLLVMGLVVAGTVFFRDWSEPNPDPGGRVNSTFYVFLGVTLAILLLVAWGNLPRGSFVFTAALFDEPYGLRPGEAAHWGIALPLLVGIVLLLVSHQWPRTRPWKWWAVPFTVGVVLSLLTAPAVRALSEYVPTVHTTLAGDPGEPAPYPASVSRLGWEWRTPEETSVLGVERGPLGPVVEITDGLVGLDGRTGEELWSYRRPFGDVVTATRAGEERAHVVLRSGETSWVGKTAADDLLLGGRVSVLDTSTGEVVEEFDRVSENPGDSVVRVVPELTVWVRQTYDSVHLEIRGIDGKERLWHFSVDAEAGAVEDGMVCGTARPEFYSSVSYGSNLLIQGNQLLLGYKCADPADFDNEWQAKDLLDSGDDRFAARLVAFDLRTGKENWSRAWDGMSGFRRLGLGDGGPILDRGADPAIAVDGLGEGRLVVLDAADGSDAVDVAQTKEGPSWVMRGSDTGGAIVSTREWRLADQERGEEDRIFHRLDASGEVIGTVRLPLAERTGEHSWAPEGAPVPLADGVVLPFVDSRDGVYEGDFSLVTAPFQDTDPGLGEATAGADILAGATERWEEASRWDEDQPGPEAIAVPGAVVSYLSLEGTSVYGWQP